MIREMHEWYATWMISAANLWSPWYCSQSVNYTSVKPRFVIATLQEAIKWSRKIFSSANKSINRSINQFLPIHHFLRIPAYDCSMHGLALSAHMLLLISNIAWAHGGVDLILAYSYVTSGCGYFSFLISRFSHTRMRSWNTIVWKNPFLNTGIQGADDFIYNSFSLRIQHSSITPQPW